MKRVKVDLKGVIPKITNIKKNVQYVVASQVLENSNFYAPEKEGTLIETSRISPDNTQVIWVEEYSRRLYYGETFNFSKDMNPNATHHWFEKAKAINHAWVDIAQKAVDKM